MNALSAWAVPAVMAAILLMGFLRGIPVFDAFLEGAKEGLKASVSILPTLVGLMTAVAMLGASGALDLLSSLLAPVICFLRLPQEVIPLALIKPFSGSAATAILTNIYADYGPDSFAGRVASVLAGSTETTFYAAAVYFGSVGVRKTRHAIPAAIIGDLTACVISALAVRLFFGS